MFMVMQSAQHLVDRGEVPDKGILTSFVSFTPPGATWLMLPGVLVFHDPRMFEYIGSLGLYVATLVGIFFLARRYFGSATAVVAVALYGFSELGLTAGSTLFLTYATRCFYVWMIYCVAKWVDEDNPNFLAGAVLTWAIGMYVFMEMAPAILVLPAVWMLYRPSIRVAPLAAVALVASVLWFPYLRFETPRNFIDIRSQVFRQSLEPANFSTAWCDASLVPRNWRNDIARTQAQNASQSAEPRSRAAHRWGSERVNILVEDMLTRFVANEVRNRPSPCRATNRSRPSRIS
jgi:4-amino-4-deoxy-L-arabinose transferase-like glycosyltransferase